MSERFPPSGESLAPTLARQMDRVCDRFEAAWKAGQRPRIEDYLGELPEPGRGESLRELLALELAYRRRRGDRLDVSEYLNRFPEAPGAVQAAVGANGAPAGAPSGPVHDVTDAALEPTHDLSRLRPGLAEASTLPNAGGVTFHPS